MSRSEIGAQGTKSCTIGERVSIKEKECNQRGSILLHILTKARIIREDVFVESSCDSELCVKKESHPF